MKKRSGFLIAAALTAAISISAVADVKSVTPAQIYQVEVTPQALDEIDAIAVVDAAIDIQIDQPLEALVIGPGTSNIDSDFSESPMMLAQTIEPDGSGVFAKGIDNGLAIPFEVGWHNIVG